eukprot:2986030-Rhodomonas_salina.1
MALRRGSRPAPGQTTRALSTAYARGLRIREKRIRRGECVYRGLHSLLVSHTARGCVSDSVGFVPGRELQYGLGGWVCTRRGGLFRIADRAGCVPGGEVEDCDVVFAVTILAEASENHILLPELRA